eukprot:gene16953-23279_t
MNNWNDLQLELSLGTNSDDDPLGFSSTLNSTYKLEDLRVGKNYMNLNGEDLQMEVCFSDLIMGKGIGRGACSTVNVAHHKKSNEFFAVKRFNVMDRKQATQLYNEICLLASFQCDALISLKGAFYDNGCVGMIIEYMDKGSLEFILDQQLRLSESVLAAIAFQIIWGVGYLHHDRHLHRDIKPANILMNSQGQVKLSDFGISKELDESIAMSSTVIGTCRYMSPERLLGEDYDTSSDIWSIGITLVELWNLAYPFGKVDTPISLSSQLDYFRNNFEKYLPSSSCSSSMRKFIKSMLEHEPERRSSCNQLLQSKWFDECRLTKSLFGSQHVIEMWLAANDKIDSSNKSISSKYSMKKQDTKTSTEDEHEYDFDDFESLDSTEDVKPGADSKRIATLGDYYTTKTKSNKFDAKLSSLNNTMKK